MNALLNKFQSVVIENDTRISESDRLYCEKEEIKYIESIKALKNVKSIYEELVNKYPEDKLYDYYNRSYITDSEVRDINDKIDKTKNEFINKVVRYFERQYNVTLDTYKIEKKYNEDIKYTSIVNEIFEQLGGFNFTEKAVNELIVASKNTIYNDDKITIKKNKLTINDYIYWHTGWNGHKSIGYNDGKISPLFKALSHFEEGITETLFYYTSIATKLNKGEEYYDIFTKHEVEYNKVKSLKFYKNGKIDIEFQTNEQANQFVNTYLAK